ncbi:MAG: hypothetical protein ABI718_01085 [Acidobacteriota bacterium]
MIRYLFGLLFPLLLAIPVSAQQDRFPPGSMAEHIACRSDPTQTYTLYLPTSFTTDRKWPALLVFDPRGRATFAAEIFRAAAEKYGWIIISSNDTRSDGPMEPNIKAVSALWPEVHLRYPTDPDRIYAAGFSGGGIVAWLLGQRTGLLAGIINSGGRLPEEIPTEKIAFVHYGTTGVRDFNYQPMHAIDALLEKKGVPHRLIVFDGSHQWLTKEMALPAVGWLELQAMKRGLRAKDQAIIAERYGADMQWASTAESEGNLLEALRRYENVAATFDGLREISEPGEKAAALRSNKEVSRERREEQSWEDYETRQTMNVFRTIKSLDDPDNPVALQRVVHDLHLDELLKRREAKGLQGEAAQRVLESIYVQTSFYIMRDAFAQKNYSKALMVLTIASRIYPDRGFVWYNIAAANARLKHKGEALDALDRAVDSGFHDAGAAQADDDLASLREEPRFQQAMTKMKSLQSSDPAPR